MRSLGTDGLLVHLAELLGRAVSEESADAAVGIVIDDEGVELHILPAPPGQHAAAALIGFHAPPEWSAIGVVAKGRARSVGAGPDRVQHVVVVHLQSRLGPSASLVGSSATALRASPDAAQGRIVEVCQRCIDQPTGPVAHSPLQWWAASWLDRLCSQPTLELVSAESDLVAQFPAGRPFGPDQDFAALAHHGRLLDQTCPWSVLRQACATGAISVPGVEAEVASWMDDGMFERWALAEVAPLPVALAELRTRLTPGLSTRLTRLLAAWDLPPEAWAVVAES